MSDTCIYSIYTCNPSHSSNGVGTAGSWMTIFYTEVTDDMRVTSGGGNAEEGELIDVVEIPVQQGREFIMDESKNKPVAMMFTMQWFYENVYDEIRQRKKKTDG